MCIIYAAADFLSHRRLGHRHYHHHNHHNHHHHYYYYHQSLLIIQYDFCHVLFLYGGPGVAHPNDLPGYFGN